MKIVLYIEFAMLMCIMSCTTKHPTVFEDNSPYQTQLNWYKGNTHTHTTNSDGDSSPNEVALWYLENGYDFLVLTDHNVVTNPEEANIASDLMLLIPGEEVSATYRSAFAGSKPIHINGIDVDRKVEPIYEQESIEHTLQENIDAIREANGIPHINHPNFRWAFSFEELQYLERYNLLEIYNGHPLVNNFGNAEHLGMEQVWDQLLTTGNQIYGIGVDDAHHFKGEFKPDRSNPGRCWVMVQAKDLTKSNILNALENGRFYFTTGVSINEINVTETCYSVEVDEPFERVEFISNEGEIVATCTESPARTFPNGKYIRAKVYGVDGSFAWTQPVFTKGERTLNQSPQYNCDCAR